MRPSPPPDEGTADYSQSAGLSPQDYGLPSKFSSWRTGQHEAVRFILASDKRFSVLSMPTGSGKSAVYVAASQARGGKTCIVTATKALQNQLLDDFSSIGMVDIRGRANYDCTLGCNCEEGYYSGCSDNRVIYGPFGYRQSRCAYRSALLTAEEAPLVVTNYQYSILSRRNPQGGVLSGIDVLVLDEAHESPDILCSCLSVTIYHDDLYRRLKQPEWPALSLYDAEEWSAWAGKMLSVARSYSDSIPSSNVKEKTRACRLVYNLESIAHAKGLWVCEPLPSGKGYSLTPVWPFEYSEDLFQHRKRVILTSATITPQTMRLLGVPDSDYDFYESPDPFPPYRCPVYYLPVLAVNRGMVENRETLQSWVDGIDAIIDKRLDRRGLVHTGSYERSRLLTAYSRHSGIMITHTRGSESLASAVETLRQSPTPAVLVSPSLTTGYDLPYSDCEYIIVSKIPFPDTSSPVMAYRCGRAVTGRAKTDEEKQARKLGTEYSYYLTVQTLVQSCGRAYRAHDDQCEVFIIDGNWGRWFYAAASSYMPFWFRRRLRRVSAVPDPPPALRREA